jgi:hypothetical protein
MREKTEGLGFVHALLCRATVGASCMIGSKSGMVLLYKHMHELGLQNKLIRNHCVGLQQNPIGKALGFKQIMTDVNAFNLLGHVG